ncbi:ATP-binding protein [Niveibacterium terrae]|uniref:ATP-binding protein n=1 Tax=Niveibacterium terrae TaxID=3373598 RepID=UPI003A91B178
MKLLPRSLFGRNLLLIVALLLAAQIAFALLYQFVAVRPRAAQFARYAQIHREAIAEALRLMPPEARAQYLDQLNRSPEFSLLTREPPAASDTPPGRMTRWLLGPVLEQMGGAKRLRWQEGARRQVWMEMRVGHEHYWLGMRGDALVRRFSVPMLLSWAFSGVLALAGAWLIQRRINRPLQSLADAAGAVARGEPVSRLPEDGPTEIATVSASFNRMADDLARTERDRALMLAGISHDLRTPLTRLRLVVEMLAGGDEQLVGSAVRSIESADRILDQFIDFARIGDSEALELSDLNALACSVVEAMAMPDEEPVLLDLGELPGLALRPGAMRRLVINLLANARRHGAGQIVLHTEAREDAIVLAVRDHGPGIPEEALAGITQPFARLGSARGGKPGAGLGLAIALRVAQRHGGRLLLENRAEGGFEARLELPLKA